MFDWVPKFVVDFMSSKALTDATAWVKKYSEAEWEKAKKEGRARATPQTEKSGPSSSSFGLPFGRRKREEEERKAREAAEKAALEAQAEAEAKRSRFLVVRAGWRRYLLVSVVLTLAAYNAVMFFSDSHEKTV